MGECSAREKTDIRSMTLPMLTEWMELRGEKAFRAKQLFAWMHRRGVQSFAEMTDLPGALRADLERTATLCALRQVQMLSSAIDGTKKFLFELEDGHVIESVLMPYHHGNSVCISSQVGCRMGCRFCASTIGGRIRNLRASEMLGQVYRIAALTGERISNVVVMGTGEPLDNLENLLRFIRLLSDESGMHLSQRGITVSTCGLTEQIRRLAREHLQITLALSLHASSQETRRQLMPVADRCPLEEVLEACRYYFQQTGRLTFEYSLVRGVNDAREDADRLASLLGGMNCHVNLIPVNPVRERDYEAPDRRQVLSFQHKLEERGLQVTIRRQMGQDINGACGQLRRSYMNGEEGR